MHDFVTAKERLTFEPANISDFYLNECAGCGRTTEEIVKELDCSYEEIEDESKTTNCGLWYCHMDCFRDSR